MTMDCDSVTNKSLQEEEIQAMFSIYDSEWQVEDPFKNSSYSINISNSSGNSVYFKVTLPEDYPLNSPPQYLISAPWMSREVKNRLIAMLENIYCENIGNCVLYQWVVKIQDFIEGDITENISFDDSKNLVDHEDANASQIALNSTCESLDNLHLSSTDEELPPIIHGEIIQDKKSVFQGHVAKVVSVEQVKKILSKLKENRKIAIATHNILAYRISIGPDSLIQDCDDDGETRAGSILLHLLQLLDVKDVVVIVSRWYGGIHLGPDRFKDINNAARKALIEAGFIQEKTKGSEKKR
ncbi:protein IMPACT-like [Argiope bruennichi]|uniref:Protein IMPACT like protein n=1 Tax=Argiope bruennichi TaxID=94029 RepID=A0A8T0EIL4_ARGBR|nr:protein IMPACT-like [Argiope bruennichi]XP_055949530.1 protein IMPACT-like [Argiope bruennichi]KAF8773730.1 Protein IMPACT like protein [Argiope bruennichi]